MTLDAFLKERGVPAIMGVDTREITRILREEGVMNALICDAVPSDLSDLRAYAIHGAVAAASVREKQEPPVKTRASAWRFWTTAPSTISSASSTGAAAT